MNPVRQFCLQAIACLTIALGLSGSTPPVCAQEPVATESPNQPTSAEDAEQQKKQVRVMAGLAAIAAIAIVGVALVTLVLVWGARLRRLNRQPLPSTRLQNEFWFLQSPKPPVSEDGPES